MKVAFVYDRVNKFGGAERVLLALHEIWPEAPIYTAVYDEKKTGWAKVFKVIPSFLQKFPLAKSTHEIYPWLTPFAFESFNFENYDIVISITSAEAKGIITKPKTLHVCYCLTPTRYLWSHEKDYLENPGLGVFNFLIRILGKPLINFFKKWDLIAAQRPDYYIAICKNVVGRIKRYYGRESEMIYPPVDINKFKMQNVKCKMTPQNSRFTRITGQANQNARRYFLIVSRLVAYKKVDLAIKAFNNLGWNLKIVGLGREMGRLKKMAKKNIEFLGELTDNELLGYYQNCQALIFPQEEDFGITSLEVQACGKPVMAYKGGGARETVIEGITGEFFYPQTPEALKKVLKSFKLKKYQARDCRKNAERFSKERFKREFKNKVEKLWKEYRNLFA